MKVQEYSCPSCTISALTRYGQTVLQTFYSAAQTLGAAVSDPPRSSASLFAQQRAFHTGLGDVDVAVLWPPDYSPVTLARPVTRLLYWWSHGYVSVPCDSIMVP